MIVQSKTLLDVVGPTDWHLESWGLTYSVWLPTATGYLSAPPTKVAFHRVFPVTNRLSASRLLRGQNTTETLMFRTAARTRTHSSSSTVKPLPRTPFHGVFSSEFCWKRRITRRRARKTSFCM